MGKKVDYKKDFKQLYMAKTHPEIVEVPRMPFFIVSGSGDPNGEEFAKATEALYSMSYAVRMSYKSENVPVGYYEYTVFPLEGVWDLIDYSKPSTDKSNFKYTLMIRQPDFLTVEGFERFLGQTKQKRSNPYLDRVRFEYLEDGLNCQMMHLGSFDDEPESFARMEAYCAEHGFIRASKIHREIYLSDPRKTEPSKLKTVLRFHVKPINKRK
ncbi:GyrI-like domain-containing protein [Paenibacillus sp. KQZ6P-2]|uniref:GyrI-like domain-containing protein n=1 Tax=Paenibacillus mangrovi TaxID=2931978 RepID=A0A9X1WVV5_9BACL|nr:GyrI-like domain-containing protein [Paenibacillus mangrovi]MCJ8014845.1 GyrI-like domain-containing protein [Paenibacillus mangrovi]